MATATLTSPFRQHVAVRGLPKYAKAGGVAAQLKFCSGMKATCLRSLIVSGSPKVSKRSLLYSVSPAGSGSEASSTHIFGNAQIVVESKDDDKIQVRVNLTGKQTQIVFDKLLSKLARTAPPIPGFRRQKGGKTSKVPKEFLVEILGEDHVTGFVIQEIVDSTLSDYATEENLEAEDYNVKTIQTVEELKSAFTPGKDFRFDAMLELKRSIEALTSTATE